jgi:hypothetical protein
MNAPVTLALTDHSPPSHLEALAPAPALLPGESLQRYQFMRRAIFSEIAPRSAIEWLLAVDVVELSWEIERYRLLRHKILEHYRQHAIEQSLRNIDLAGIPPKLEDAARCHIRRNASDWRTNPNAAADIEARLAAHGLDQHAINAETIAQASENLHVVPDSARGRTKS